ncbi:SLC13 family permease [Adlercreutzia equolifaciens]|uniref:SLC13 family permease n=1 Tax=Adlercreutzia equolifaciens TaxID=446660 RepID=UPI0003898734|nr:SLC13 family permease [Adlercreutzia equolifaciens]BAN77678.1 citrate transporter [Adlercreutzia equolifaciens DSM 19450]
MRISATTPAAFLREHAVLVVAAVAAAASALAVPPDEAYLGYFDWKTLGCLFCVLAVASALRLMGAFDRAARAVIARFRRPGPLALALVLTTAALSCVATNDMALIMMLPLSAATLMGANLPRLVTPVFVLQSLAANLCGMIVPFGNPQNLYLYSYYGLGLGDFLAAMALPFALSTAGIVACTWWLCGQSNGGSDRDDTRSLAAPMPLSRRRLAIYGALVALTLLAVFRIVPVAAAVAVVAAALAALDRRALAAVDWGLLATFACFFVFAGNMARVPEVSAWLSPLMADHGLLVSAGLSQIISNVPAAVLLSHFTGAWQPLLVGVNIGGAGTLVGSLASLITLQHFTSVRKIFPRAAALPELSTGRFLVLFSVLNFAFLALLLIACGMTFSF